MLTGTEQYVILGAGMDTFAFHEKEFLAKHKVFEIDHLLTQADKKERIASAGWTVPENLTFVPVDFTRDSLTQRLTAGGFDMTAKSFFSWLGVTYYLSAEAIGKTLAELSPLCADGSTLVFDYPDENLFDAPERWTLPGRDSAEEYDKLTAYLKTYSGRTVRNIFWSANNYALPPKPTETGCRIIYWYVDEEKKARRGNIRFIRRYFPHAKMRGIPKMEHAELVMIYPQEFYRRATEFFTK